jgi:hypothetical protein
MGNHFHLVVETPQGNLVAGMNWLIETYAARSGMGTAGYVNNRPYRWRQGTLE